MIIFLAFPQTPGEGLAAWRLRSPSFGVRHRSAAGFFDSPFLFLRKGHRGLVWGFPILHFPCLFHFYRWRKSRGRRHEEGLRDVICHKGSGGWSVISFKCMVCVHLVMLFFSIIVISFQRILFTNTAMIFISIIFRMWFCSFNSLFVRFPPPPFRSHRFRSPIFLGVLFLICRPQANDRTAFMTPLAHVPGPSPCSSDG